MHSCARQDTSKIIAFYLPQFHPTAENNEWWGEGFTDWVNVAKTRPQFPEHYQPHIPADLGFYDLRLPQTRHAQAELAKKFGIHGFCYYHYWFKGRRILSTPLDEILQSGDPELPFCLCWANEDWTRTWDGRGKSILIKQEYSDDDDRLHMEWLKNVFTDSRYIRINGKPLFLVYRAGRLPSPSTTAATWRKAAKDLGIGDIYLCRVESFPEERGDPADIGFDAAVEFQPDWGNLGDPDRIVEGSGQTLYDYEDFVQRQINKPVVPYKFHRCVTPSWDNSPRRSIGALTLTNSTPSAFNWWLSQVLANEINSGDSESGLIFVNAWNEWGEGCHLEPDRRFGSAYLSAISDAICNPSNEGLQSGSRIADASATNESRQSMHSQNDPIPAVDPPPRTIEESHRDELLEMLQTAEQKISILEDTLFRSEREIKRMRDSLSWRITGPVRAIINLITTSLLHFKNHK